MMWEWKVSLSWVLTSWVRKGIGCGEEGGLKWLKTRKCENIIVVVKFLDLKFHIYVFKLHIYIAYWRFQDTSYISINLAHAHFQGVWNLRWNFGHLTFLSFTGRLYEWLLKWVNKSLQSWKWNWRLFMLLSSPGQQLRPLPHFKPPSNNTQFYSRQKQGSA